MPYSAGHFTVPGSTGTVTVSGLGFPVQGVVFFGCNFTTEDAVDTSTGTGVWMGLGAPDMDNPGTIREYAVGHVVDGDAMHANSVAVSSPNPSGDGTALYEASLTNLGDGSFTVDFTTAAAGGHKVRYLAWGGFQNIAALDQASGNQTRTLGWKPESAFGINNYGTGPANINFYHIVAYGAHAYRSSSISSWKSAYIQAASVPSSISSQGRTQCTQEQGSGARTMLTCHFTGPFMTDGGDFCRPDTGTLTDIFTQTDVGNYASFVVWDGISQPKSPTIPVNLNDTADTTYADLDAVTAVFYMTMSDSPSGSGSNRGAAGGFGVATPDYQACVAVDATPGTSRGAFQSSQYGFCDRVDGAGVHAGTVLVDTTTNVVTLTTEVADVGVGSLTSIGYFGPLMEGNWIPQIYRLVMPT